MATLQGKQIDIIQDDNGAFYSLQLIDPVALQSQIDGINQSTQSQIKNLQTQIDACQPNSPSLLVLGAQPPLTPKP